MTRVKYDLTPSNTPRELACCPTTVIEKGWGRTVDGVGEVFAYHAPQEHAHQILNVETVKLLHIAKGRRLSRHYHLDKREFFVLACGRLEVEIWDRHGIRNVVEMRVDSRLIIEPGWQHRMTGLDEVNVLVEVSTLDTPEDSYRIERGD